MLLIIIRAAFVLVVAGLGVRLAKLPADGHNPALLFAVVVAAAIARSTWAGSGPRDTIAQDRL